VYVFDKWLALSKQKGLTVAMQYHDEFLVVVQEGKQQECGELIYKSIDELNEIINLDVPISAESAFGKSYASVH
jgi:DNA polymerase I-like protein with 3'-5' exonuclease and polymerase domains